MLVIFLCNNSNQYHMARDRLKYVFEIKEKINKQKTREIKMKKILVKKWSSSARTDLSLSLSLCLCRHSFLSSILCPYRIVGIFFLVVIVKGSIGERHMSSSLLLQQCPVCLIRFCRIVLEIGDRWHKNCRLVGSCFEFVFFSINIFTNPSARAGYDTRSIFKRSLTGFNSEYSFS